MRSVKKSVIREARLREIKSEMMNSERLRAHFEENPRDLLALRHDKPLHVTKPKPQLKHLPDYLVPNAMVAANPINISIPFHKRTKKGYRTSVRLDHIHHSSSQRFTDVLETEQRPA